MRNPPPPIPQDWGRATPRAKVVATAASIALPPAFSTSSPTSEAAGASEAITPPRLLTASLYREPSAANVSPAGNIRISINVIAAKARYIVLFSSNHSTWQLSDLSYELCPHSPRFRWQVRVYGMMPPT